MILTFTWPSTTDRAGGVTALYEFANAMARRGHEVHFVHGPAWPGLIESVEELAWFGFDPRVEHHIVSELTAASLPPADVVFRGDLPGGGLPCTFVQGFRMVPLELEREALAWPGPKVCVSRWLVDVGRAFGVPAARLWHVPMGLDHDLFVDRVPADERPFDVAMWQNPHPSKGSHVGWRVLAEARRRVPGLRAVVFSGGPMPPPAERSSESMPWVEVRTGLDQLGLATEVYNASRVFLQPSFVEGFGFTAVEAMACGAALVTTDNGGSRDYAVDGQTALVRPIGDVDALAAAVAELVTDAPLRARLAAAGERHVRRFDWDEGARILEGHLEAYLADPAAFDGPFELETDPSADPVGAVLAQG